MKAKRSAKCKKVKSPPNHLDSEIMKLKTNELDFHPEKREEFTIDDRAFTIDERMFLEQSDTYNTQRMKQISDTFVKSSKSYYMSN